MVLSEFVLPERIKPLEQHLSKRVTNFLIPIAMGLCI